MGRFTSAAARRHARLVTSPRTRAWPCTPSGEDVLVLEGIAEVVTDPEPALAERVSAASVAKYGMGSHDIEVSYVVRPRIVFAWTASGFPRTATRWVFG